MNCVFAKVPPDPLMLSLSLLLPLLLGTGENVLVCMSNRQVWHSDMSNGGTSLLPLNYIRRGSGAGCDKRKKFWGSTREVSVSGGSLNGPGSPECAW